MEYKKRYAASKLLEYYDLVDLEARNTFHKEVGAGTLKCIIGFNHYGSRDNKINSRLIGNKCPRYSQEE